MFVDILKPGNRGTLTPNTINDIIVKVDSLPFNASQSFNMKVEIKIDNDWQEVELTNLYYLKNDEKINMGKDTKIPVMSCARTYVLESRIPNNKEIKELRIKFIGYEPSKIIYSHVISVSSTDKLEFTINEPSITDSLVTRVKVILDMDVKLPENITMQVYATNNPLDDEIVWEDISASVFNGVYAKLKNKNAKKGFGLDLKVLFTKNDYNANVIIHSLNYVFY